MITLQERNDINPICPHCSNPITTLSFKTIQGMFGKRYIYFCSACKKTLGVSHRKGFWMG